MVAVLAANALPEIPTAWDTALLVTYVLVFLTKPIGFLKVILALDFPSSDMLNESTALVLMFSIGPLLFWFLTKLCCCLAGTIEFE